MTTSLQHRSTAAVMGINLVEFAGVLTAIAGLLVGIFAWTRWSAEAQIKAYEGRVTDLQEQIKRVEDDADERANELRADFQRQLQDVKQAMLVQAQTIERQEIQLGDYARHVSKLERIMAAAQLEIPEFEASRLRGGRNG